MRRPTYDDIRKDIERRYRKPLTDQQWQAVLEDGCVDEYPAEENEIMNLILKVHAIVHEERKRAGRVLKASSARARTPLVALSKLVALVAGWQPEVVELRRSLLQGRALEPQAIEDWIRRMAKKEGQPTVWVTLPLKDGQLVDFRTEPGRTRPPGWYVDPPLTMSRLDLREIGPRFLHYPAFRPRVGFADAGKTPQKERKGLVIPIVGRIAVKDGGELDRLRLLTEYLAAEFTWTRDQATHFVLGRAVPVLDTRRATRSGGRKTSLLSMQLNVDLTMTEKEVQKLYREEKRRIWTRLPVPIERRLDERKLELAAFLLKRPGGESWDDKRKEWNRQCSRWRKNEWGQKHRPSFAREAETLMGWVRSVFDVTTSLPGGLSNGKRQ